MMGETKHLEKSVLNDQAKINDGLTAINKISRSHCINQSRIHICAKFANSRHKARFSEAGKLAVHARTLCSTI